ncbi:TPA: hypothetical protein ACPTCW_004196 [Yersinia enterocolitica]|uniref:hypothetical protein n=1 Tax=Lelliottia amnigena TaxID=61646 RepID=UPI000FA44BD0|nr:hypothetical protein [Lelliottia amnigena]UJD95204.1 hypothetical protein FS593_13225 [Lelliottia amnigena]HDL6888255.1 hypothetical protein [Yersinia enterocolitica]HDL6901688.1 hypothetical protein [Yersinia enterocolitica]
MKILNFEILSDGDIVERIIDNKVHVRKNNGAYIVYTLHTDNPEFMDFDVFVVQKGDGFISTKLNADLSDLDKTLGVSDD